MSKILVTGGAGFIGSHLVDRLISLGHKVIVIDNLYTGKYENINKDAFFVNIDITSYDDLDFIFYNEKPDYVYHLAAQTNLRKSIEYPILDAETNIMGSLNIFKLCEEYGVKKVIFTSTGAVYSDNNIPWSENAETEPLSPYGLSKLTAEKYLQNFGVPFSILRLANVYGPRQLGGESGIVSILINDILNDRVPKMFGGTQTRDFIYIDDVVDVLIKFMDKTSIFNPNIFNVGTSIQTSIFEIADMISNEMNYDGKYEFLGKLDGELVQSALDNYKLKCLLEWEPKTVIEAGIKKTIDYFRAS